ncbi:TetR/AcrR family transcriptional regulator [Bacillus pumilus]|uniref:TetR/AcrR family transcriptional regulator n=1 Tax=Bacillus TaxID=1386 RepID=UPI00017A5DCB|nr:MULTISPECIES: TetR/AcrR family transcriptional regulator [Bacillus]EDW22332.1 HTH-type transcriptional regulator PksA [Bacillus pumilus ATCC 7061]MCR4352482.1 TetR/AcrR family transcriptional regulator [Bacillus pumilus]MCY7504292.1 TetR/AcrR family transcriptional regulator [Bacillus pumilus]MDR4268720.1 TetR/AcrR family transcriptional regulator [Bacillus pumilus]MED4629584.1 TetR/AcrR family transcriptional regulator [Bacillus pumilus]
MPKIVDHYKQKQKVAQAAMRVIKQDGLENASVRKVAVEAGISAGSMRHYFSTQQELFLFSMTLIQERVKERMTGLQLNGSTEENVFALLEQVLPLDEERRFEMEVWQAFTVKSMTEPDLQPLNAKMYDELFQMTQYCLMKLKEDGLLLDHIDLLVETERLYAVINGLALNGILQPHRLPPQLIRSVLQMHLQSITKKDMSPS